MFKNLTLICPSDSNLNSVMPEKASKKADQKFCLTLNK